MYQPSLIKNYSFVPGLILFIGLFFLGMYAGTAFGAMQSSSTSIVVHAESSQGANGDHGSPGMNGSDGTAGASSASVRIKTIINNQIVQNIHERTESVKGGGVAIHISRSNTFGSTSSSLNSSHPVAVNSRTVSRIQRARPESISEVEFTPRKGDSILLQDMTQETQDGIYSSLKSFFIHVATLFTF